MGILHSQLTDAIGDLKKAGLYRSPRVVESVHGPVITLSGREVVNFSSNDYLGLSQRPELASAAAAAAHDYGWGAGSARLLSGTTEWHARLEERIARFLETEAALVFPAGYLANLGLLPAIAGEGDLVLSDELNHASLIDACRLSKARVEIYRHGDVDAVIRLLRNRPPAKRTLLLTETVFSMDGDVAPLRELVGLASFHEADLVVDDAHGFGIFGPQGRGVPSELGLNRVLTFRTATLSKAAGSSGGFVAASAASIDYLRNRARPFLFSTASPAAVCAAGIAAVDLLEKADEERVRLWENVRRLRTALRALGFDLRCSESPILPVVLGSNERVLAASAKLFEAGFHLPAIRPPTVPEGQSRLRITVTALHRPEHLDALLDQMRRL